MLSLVDPNIKSNPILTAHSSPIGLNTKPLVFTLEQVTQLHPWDPHFSSHHLVGSEPQPCTLTHPLVDHNLIILLTKLPAVSGYSDRQRLTSFALDV
jgi:hypothetical protein